MEATLEPRLVMKGEDGKPFVSGEFFVAAYQRGFRWGRHEVRQLLDDIQAMREKRRPGAHFPTTTTSSPSLFSLGRTEHGSW